MSLGCLRIDCRRYHGGVTHDRGVECGGAACLSAQRSSKNQTDLFSGQGKVDHRLGL